MSKVEILFLAANPAGTSPLALDEEIREIESKLRAAEHRDSLHMTSKWAVRPDDLLQSLNQHKPHVVHFSGHGSPTEEIVLVDEQTQHPKTVSKKALMSLFRTLKDNIRVVVLNACYSRSQAEAITQAVDCAVGMNRSIGDQAAITFAASFYRAIGFGRSIKNAFDQGVTALLLAGIPEVDTPELIVRSGVDSTTIVLVGDQQPQRRRPSRPPVPRMESTGPVPTAAPEPVEVFYSYSRADDDLRKEVEKSLVLIRRQGLIRPCHDREITGGTEWKDRIDENLNSADIVLLLVSSDFLASDYIWDKELKRAMERHEASEARVIPIILRPCDWHAAPFAKLQALPKDGKAITSWRDKDEALLNVAEGIRRVIAEL